MPRRTLRSERSNRGGSSVVAMQSGGGSVPFPPFATGTSYTISAGVYTSLVSFWPLNDANVTTFNPTCLETVAARNFSNNAGQGGLMPQRPSLIARVTQERSYLFSASSAAIFFSGFGAAPYDKTGLDTVSMAAFISPNIKRSGSETYYWLFTKNDGAFTNALSACTGYFWGLVWDGTKTVLVLHQRTSAVDWLEVRGTTDLRNGLGYHVAVTRASGKVQANVNLYVRGTLETMALGPGSPSSYVGSTTTTSGACIGGRGGGGGAQTLDAWMSHLAFFSAVLPATGAGSVAGLAVQAVPPVTIFTGTGNPVPILHLGDWDSDIDDAGATALLVAAQRKGLIRKLANIVDTSNVYSAAAVASFDTAKGISATTAAYQGAGRQTVSGWAQGVATAFNPGKTRADYAADLLITMRTALAAEAPGTVRILCTGPEFELQLLLQSPGDGISPLTGLQLVASRCTGIWLMGGYASSATVEYNFGQAPVAANYVFLNNPVPIYDVGFEIGNSIITGYGGNPSIDPIRDAYDLVAGGGASYDMIAAYGCVFPSNAVLNFAITNGTNTVNSGTGANTWSVTAGTHNQYAFATTGGAAKIAIENFMNDASYP